MEILYSQKPEVEYNDVRFIICKETGMQNLKFRHRGVFVSIFVDSKQFRIFTPNYTAVKRDKTTLELQRATYRDRLPKELFTAHEIKFRQEEETERFEEAWAETNIEAIAYKYTPQTLSDKKIGIWVQRTGVWRKCECILEGNVLKFNITVPGLNKNQIELTKDSYVDVDYNYNDRSRHGQPHVLKVYEKASNHKESVLLAFPIFEKMAEWLIAMFYTIGM